jgi:GNAT superfamily N-acetyltransferase
VLPDGFTLGPMSPEEVAVLDDWAADEGWNPGLADLVIAWELEPDAFIALRRGDDLAGGGTIFSYGSRFGFMGLFIMRPELRGAGLGTILWHRRLELLRARLEQNATIGMDGVFAMVPFYERGGFSLAYRDLRFEGVATGVADPAAIRLGAADLAELARFDSFHFPAPRAGFLERWLTQPGGHAVGLRERDVLVAYGVSRPCRSGHKLGPVFADRADLAERVVADLISRVEGGRVQIDIPEPNEAGLELAGRFGLTESFGCARMYHGPAPGLPLQRIFGVTSLEFG